MNSVYIRLKGGSSSQTPSNTQVRTQVTNTFSNNILTHQQFDFSNNQEINITDESLIRGSNNSVFQDPLPDDLYIYFQNVRSINRRDHEVQHVVDKYPVDTVVLLECMNRPKSKFFGTNSYSDFSNLFKSVNGSRLSSGIFINSKNLI